MSDETEVNTGPDEEWRANETKTGHVYSKGRTGPLRDGYATCRLCGAHENEDAILRPCPQNPLTLARAACPECEKLETQDKPKTLFDVVAEAVRRGDDRVRIVPLSQVLRMQSVKAGCQITIGAPAEVLSWIGNGEVSGGLLLVDKALLISPDGQEIK